MQCYEQLLYMKEIDRITLKICISMNTHNKHPNSAILKHTVADDNKFRWGKLNHSPHSSPTPSSPSYKYVPDHMISMVMWPNAVLILKKFNFLFRVEWGEGQQFLIHCCDCKVSCSVPDLPRLTISRPVSLTFLKLFTLKQCLYCKPYSNFLLPQNVQQC